MSEESSKPVKKYYDYISVGNRTKQVVYFVEPHDKPAHFELFFKENPLLKTIVICKSKKTADTLGIYLKENGMNASVIHGNHRASQIQDASLAFNEADTALLITTSKIYESLEIDTLNRVLYYELPFEAADYFKTLRGVDEVGESILFVSSDDEKTLETLELMMKYEIPQLEIEAFSHTPLPKIDKSKKKKPRHTKNKKIKTAKRKED
jgi:ATP-dependent RNA helicase RhlE